MSETTTSKIERGIGHGGESDPLSLLRQMVRIREAEMKVLDLRREDLIAGSTHPCVGQEVVPVSVLSVLGATDRVSATYRGHGWALACGLPLVDFFARGGSLKSSWYGDCLPERDFPTLIDLYRQGRLPLEKFVSERIGLDGIEDAFHKMHAGEVLRSVVVL